MNDDGDDDDVDGPKAIEKISNVLWASMVGLFVSTNTLFSHQMYKSIN